MAAKKATPAGKGALVKQPSSTEIANIDAQMAAKMANLADRISGPGGNKLSVDGKMFRGPDGVSHPGPIQVVIVEFNTRHLYYGGVPYDRNNIVPPVCFAIGDNPRAMVPSANSPDRQADDCQSCPNNLFFSQGKGKACDNRRILAVLRDDAASEDPILLLSVSPTALKNFDNHVMSVSARFEGAHIINRVTEVSFDQEAAHPKLLFADKGPNRRVLEHKARYNEALAILVVEPDMSMQNAVTAQASGRAAPRAPARRQAARR